MANQVFRSWAQLQTVLAVAENGSYRRAAAALGVTSSTVARHIETISEELGHPIFLPSGNLWQLTALGEELVRIAENAQTGVGFAIKSVENQADFTGSIRINTLSFVISDFLSPALDTWRANHPHAQLLIDASDKTTAVERGEADIALRLTRPDTPGIARFKLANCPVGVFTPKGGDPNNWVGLPDQVDYLKLPEVELAKRHFTTEPMFRLDSYQAIASGAISAGISCLSPTCMARNHPELQLATRDGEPVMVNRELWFLFYETRKNDPAIVAARDWIKSVFQSPNKCMCGECGFP